MVSFTQSALETSLIFSSSADELRQLIQKQMKQKELLECELMKEREKLEMIRFDIVTLTSPMMSRSEFQQLCDDLSRLQSVCERLGDEIDIVSARELSQLPSSKWFLTKILFFSSKITCCAFAFEAEPSPTTDSLSAPLPFSSAITFSHATVPDGVFASPLSASTAAQLHRRDARDRTHQQPPKSHR